MKRSLTYAMAGTLVVALAGACGDDESDPAGGGSTSTGTTSTGVGGSGAAGGQTSTGGTGGVVGGSGSGGIADCDASVQSGAVCTDGSPLCATTTGCCQCRELVGCGWDPLWICVMPPGDPLCPATAPTHADPCTDEGIVCEYCRVDEVELWRCHNGAWVGQMPNCPE